MTGRESLHVKASLLVTGLLLVSGFSAAGAVQPPRLVLQITVDALRGDLPGRYAHLFGDGGFRCGADACELSRRQAAFGLNWKPAV